MTQLRIVGPGVSFGVVIGTSRSSNCWTPINTDISGEVAAEPRAANMSSQKPMTFASQGEALRFFDGLPPVAPDDLTGLWQGHGIETGHPLDGVLENLGWYGKRFNADLRADALLFRAGARRLTPLDPALIPLKLAFRLNRFGRSRIARSWFSYLQKGLRARGPVASIKPLPFRGKVSAAMVYDRQPIIDHFRRLDDETILGVMTVEGESRFYFFLLTPP